MRLITSRRYLIPILLVLGVYTVGYFDRINLAVVMPLISRDLRLSPSQSGLVLSIFLIGYSVMPLPGGYLADRIGAKKILVASTAWFTVFAALTGAAWNFVSLLVVRLMFGAGSGAEIPSMAKTVAIWSPPRRLGASMSLSMVGVCLGAITASLLASTIAVDLGWRAVFILMALPGAAVTALIYFLLRDSGDGVGPTAAATRQQAPERLRRGQIYRHWSIWALNIGSFGFNITFWGLNSWVPTYLVNVRHLSLEGSALLTTLPWIAALLGLLVLGTLADKVPSRKYLCGASYLVSGLALLFAFRAATSDSAAALLAVSYFFMMGGISVHQSMILILVEPAAVGTAFGSMSFIGQIGGFIAPTAIGFMVQASGGYWAPFLLMIIAISVAGLLLCSVREKRIDLGLSAGEPPLAEVEGSPPAANVPGSSA